LSRNIVVSIICAAATFASTNSLAAVHGGNKISARSSPTNGKKIPLMAIAASAVSLTVNDVSASSHFFVTHFGFHEKMSDGKGGFASLERKDCALNVIFLRRGSSVLPESFRHQHAAGVILAFTVKGIKSEEHRLRGEGVAITLPLREEAWGERLFQVTDPNGIIIQLVEWSDPPQAKRNTHAK